MTTGFTHWLRAKLRQVYPLPATDMSGDPLSALARDAVERNRAAATANIEASNGVSEAVRQTLALMETASNERH